MFQSFALPKWKKVLALFVFHFETLRVFDHLRGEKPTENIS